MASWNVANALPPGSISEDFYVFKVRLLNNMTSDFEEYRVVAESFDYAIVAVKSYLHNEDCEICGVWLEDIVWVYDPERALAAE